MTRKELVKKLAEHLEVTSAYLGAPTFAYQVGDYTVDRHGRILDGEGRVVGLDALLTGTSPEANGKEEVGLEIVAEPETVTNLEVELPLEGYQGQSLRNLLHVIYSRQPLIKKALGFKTDLVDEKTIAALKEKPMVTLEHFQRAMEGVSVPGIDINYDKEIITFKLGPEGDNPGKVEAATKLFGLINLNARRLKRNVSAKVKPTENEKYSLRIWLLRLGMIGDEYKLARRVLLKNLSGNSSFRRPVKGEAVNA
jgi:hypothetical protein